MIQLKSAFQNRLRMLLKKIMHDSRRLLFTNVCRIQQLTCEIDERLILFQIYQQCNAITKHQPLQGRG